MRKPKYTDGDLQSALRAVKNGASVNSAAKLHNIPEASLRKKLKHGEDRISYNKFSGVFTQEEEEQLFDYLIACGDFGYGRTSKQVMNESERFLSRGPPRSRSFPHKNPSRHWFYRFLKRVGALRKILCGTKSMIIDNPTETGIKAFHHQVTDHLKRLGLHDFLYHNDRIACASTTSFHFHPVECINPTVDVHTFPQDVNVIITTLANGKFLPPFIMFKHERKAEVEFLESVQYGKCPDNKLNTEAFLDYIVKSVGNYIEKNKVERPFFLFLENQLECMSLQAYEYCRADEIILIRMYPNSIWDMNPLDYGLFTHLKLLWNSFLSETKVNFGTSVSLSNFGTLLNEFIEARSYSLTPHIEKAFAKTGMFPWSDSEIDYEGLKECYHPTNPKIPKIGPTIFIRKGELKSFCYFKIDSVCYKSSLYCSSIQIRYVKSAD